MIAKQCTVYGLAHAYFEPWASFHPGFIDRSHRPGSPAPAQQLNRLDLNSRVRLYDSLRGDASLFHIKFMEIPLLTF